MIGCRKVRLLKCKMNKSAGVINGTRLLAEENDSTAEKCVACGKLTEYDETTPVNERNYYVLGAGQLCGSCFAKLYPFGIDQ